MLISPSLLLQGDILSQSLTVPKDFQLEAKKEQCPHVCRCLLEGHFRHCHSVHVGNIQMCRPSSYTALRQFGLNQPRSWFFKVSKVPCNKTSYSETLSWEIVPILHKVVEDFQDVILPCSLVWAPNQWSSSILNSTKGWKWFVIEQKFAFSHMWPTYNQALLLLTSDSVFLLVILVCFIC